MDQKEHNAVALAACDLQAAAVRIGRAPSLETMADAADAFEAVWLRWYLLEPEAAPGLQAAMDEADRAMSALKAALAAAHITARRGQGLAGELRAEGEQARVQLAVAEATVQAVECDMARLAANPLGWTPGFSRARGAA